MARSQEACLPVMDVRRRHHGCKTRPLYLVMQRKQYTSHSEQREEGTTISKRRIATEKGGGGETKTERERNTEREEQRERVVLEESSMTWESERGPMLW